MEYLKNGVAGSIMTANEARRKLDLPDGDGGDVLLANGSIVPLIMAGAAYQKGQQDTVEPEETEEPEQTEETIEPDAENPDTEDTDDTDEVEDDDEQGGGE